MLGVHTFEALLRVFIVKLHYSGGGGALRHRICVCGVVTGRGSSWTREFVLYERKQQNQETIHMWDCAQGRGVRGEFWINAASFI